MKRSYFKRLIWIPTIAAGFCAADLTAAEISAPASVLKRMDAEGKAVQALLMQLDQNSAGSVAHDHLIFVDTSASQVGAHRNHSLAALQAMLKTIPQSDRVQIFAVDVQAESLMTAFDTATSAAVQSAVASLEARIPLGATNMQSVVTAGLAAKDAKRNCSISYIGDGMSKADLLETGEVRTMVTSLRDAKVPFNSYAVGPEINLQVLGILAHHTGGYVDFDDRSDTTTEAKAGLKLAAEHGAKLGKAIQLPVVFPSNVQIKGAATAKLPLLPLRSDRETIQILRGDLPADAKVVVTTDTKGQTLEWNVSTTAEKSDSAFLVAAADQADSDHGLSNALAGRKLMQVYRSSFNKSLDDTVALGAQQLKAGRLEKADQTARRLAAVDPTNADAKWLSSQTAQLRVQQVSQNLGKKGLADVESRVNPDPESSMTREQEQVIRVKTEKLRSQIGNAIEDAKRSDPVSGLARLKQAENAVRASSDIAPEDRGILLKRLDGEINLMKILVDKQAQDRVQLAEQLAQLEAQKRLVDEMLLDESKLEGLIERVRGLMVDGKHGRDDAYAEAQNVADVAIDLRPGEGTSSAARFDAEAAHQLTRAFRLRARRADQLLEALHRTEIAHIPFPDEPPVRFPPAEVWAALTERRQKWKNIDLRSENPRELRIQNELKKPTDVQFTDTPLTDALDFLEQAHEIEIVIDDTALSEESISTDTPVNLILNGVSLRSVLRLMLDKLKLTYVIEDEVMKITTLTEADKKTSTRVYPVADLVMPIVSGGGGMGGMGGGMGGMGGGMGGMGGGMGGMGGGGMGGGMFNVPPEEVAPKANEAKPANKGINNDTIRSLKKKQ